MGIFIDPADFVSQGFDGKIHLFFLLFVYGFILSKSSALISDGSELLLLIPSLAGIVGTVVLPILGAVPDGAIVLFSGLGPGAADQISVGVGALAGSTIMLLTIPWALCIIMGRVDIVSGQAHYGGKPKLTAANQMSLTGAGITPRSSIAFNAKIMMLTCLSYVIVQGAAFGSDCGETNEHCNAKREHWFVFIALLTSIAFFIGYTVYNVKYGDNEDTEDFIAEVKKQAIESHIISLSVAFENDLPKDVSYGSITNKGYEGEKRFNDALKTFFNRYDQDGNGAIDASELRVLLKDVNEDMSDEKFHAFMKQIDTDNSGTIEFREFAVAMKNFIIRKNEYLVEKVLVTNNTALQVQSPDHDHHTAGFDHHEEEPADDDASETEEVPEDIAALPADKQKLRILWRAFWMMGLGTAVTLIFSDPMVDVLNALGNSFNIKPFYVAFVLAPVASNASELIASIAYARKKTKKTITISLGALEGAACMNNTFCLSIFLILIFFNPALAWDFSAETISIVFVEFCLFVVAWRFKTQRVWMAFVILLFYPISLFLVYMLENHAGLN